MGENINTDKSIREKLENFSVEPPLHVWDNVQEVLALQRRKKRMVIARWIAAAAVVLIAFLAGWYFNDARKVPIQAGAEQQSISPSESSRETLKKQPSNDVISIAESIPEQKEVVPQKPELASSYESAQKTTVNLIAEGPKRFKMNYMSPQKARMNADRTEIQLEKRSVMGAQIAISEQEKMIIADNVKSIYTKKEKENAWVMGMNISPSYSSHVASHTDRYAQNMNYSGENGTGNLGGGLSVRYKTGKKLSFESGVYYAQNGQKSINSYRSLDYIKGPAFANGPEYDKHYNLSSATPSFSNSVNVSNGNMAMNSTAGVIAMRGTPKGATITSDPESVNSGNSIVLVADGEFSQVFDFIEVPFYLRYSLLDKRLGFEILGGLNAGVVVGNRAYIDNSFGLQNIGRTEDISRLNVSGTVGVGMNYNIGKHFSVALEPRFNYYFNSINKNKDVTYRPYRLGLYSGVYYEF